MLVGEFMDLHSVEVEQGNRFEFGANWTKFLKRLTPERVETAEQSLKRTLGLETLNARRFLDIGSGSGLFSLAAYRLGARVHSFDYDPLSVACTKELRRRFCSDNQGWAVEQGSVLDEKYLDGLGQFDIVYSWGVLHHTGALWKALTNAAQRVAPRGTLVIAIYNDQGRQSRRWLAIKKLYNRLPRAVRTLYAGMIVGLMQARYFLGAILSGRPLAYISEVAHYDTRNPRGMSFWRDKVDWIGGYPFEVAKPEEVFRFLRDRGFRLKELKTCGGGYGGNQFVFDKCE